MNQDRGHHGGTSPETESPLEPTHADRARTLLYQGGHSTLATHSDKHPGFPFASIMPYALDAVGRPIFLISSMAMHTHNLKRDPRATLLVAQASAGDQLGAARVSVIGEVQPVLEAEQEQDRECYLAAHPTARNWVGFGDFAFYRLEVVDVYFVGGFGTMGWIRPSDYAQATPDPLADSAPEILAHMNEGHLDAMLLIAQRHAEVKATHAEMTAVDRLGFHLRLETSGRVQGTRVNFPQPANSSYEVHEQLLLMVQQARED